MEWNRKFKAQSYGVPIQKHKSLPIYVTKEFDFYRCINFDDAFYGKTVSELHNGNLRNSSGRFSKLFPGMKVSYWADCPKTAIAEVKRHEKITNYLMFCAYDDASSFIPIYNMENLKILDGTKCGIQDIIDKIDNNDTYDLSKKEKKLMNDIFNEGFDCIAYNSRAHENGECYIFLEDGFNKLAIKELKLKYKTNFNIIRCAFSSDYIPNLENYGSYFAPKCKVKTNLDYLKSNEYLERKGLFDKNIKK